MLMNCIKNVHDTVKLLLMAHNTSWHNSIKKRAQTAHPLRHLPGCVPLAVHHVCVNVWVCQEQLHRLPVV